MLEHLERAGVIGFDTEASGPLLVGLPKKRSFINIFRSQLTGISFASEEKSFYVPMAHVSGNLPAFLHPRILRFFENTTATLVAHNLVHERYFLPLPEDCDRLVDTQVLYWLLQRQATAKAPYNLKCLASRFLGRERPDFEETTGGLSFSQLDPKNGLEYACADAEDALDLFLLVRDELTSAGLDDWCRCVEMPFTKTLRHMHTAGMGICASSIREYVSELEQERRDLMEDWAWLAPEHLSNPGSSTQLQGLYEAGIWSSEGIERTASGALKADSHAVKQQLSILPEDSVGWHLAKLKLDIALSSKIIGTYGTKLIDLAHQYPDGRLHGNLHHTGTATGRLSSSYPNLQNIPARTEMGLRVRSAFVPMDGHMLVSADYSQIELRVLAAYCGRGVLFDAYRAGRDVHQATADVLGEDRSVGKTVNFLKVYGGGASRLAKVLDCSPSRARRIDKEYNERFPEVADMMGSLLEDAYRTGRAQTLSGRFRDVSDLPALRERLDRLESAGYRWRMDDPGKEEAYRRAWLECSGRERQATNAVIQGSAADICKVAMVKLFESLPTGYRMICQVHDEIILEVPENEVDRAKEWLTVTMEGAWDLPIPLVAEAGHGKSWKDLK